MSFNLTIVPPPRQAFSDNPERDLPQMEEPNSASSGTRPKLLAPPSPRSPDPFFPPSQDLPLTPRTTRRTFDDYNSAFDRRIEATDSHYDKQRIRATKWALSCCEPCIVKRVACHAPTKGKMCCCNVQNIPLHKLNGRIKCVQKCSKGCAAISCCLTCIFTLGCSLKNETCCCTTNNAKIAPISG
jgi:hypothetical protein